MRKTLFEKCMQVHLSGIALAIILMILPAISFQAVAAPRQISGVVTSATDNAPLIGVSVVEKGTTNGTITDLNGKYTLEVESGTLMFSYVGYITQQVVSEKKSIVNVAMQEDNQKLSEVVVVGYGVQKKKLVTGATVQVKGDDLSKLNTTSPLQALQGQTPGVNISSTSGQPGSDMKVTVRGLGTISNSQPLYIIDGIGGDISTLNPADIESIDVLKDAASAAIYGAQAANGVVLVTTKSGKEGKGQVTFDGYYGVQSVSRKAQMLNSKEYMTIMDEQALNSGSKAYDWTTLKSIYDANGNVYDTDWVDSMFKDDAKVESYTLGITGGSKTSSFAMSLGYLDQEGVAGGKDVSNYEKYNFRINSEHKLYDNFLVVGEHVNFVYTKKRGINVGNQYNNTLRGAFATSPLTPIYSENGYNGSIYNDTSTSDWYKGDGNPYGAMMTNNQNQTTGQTFHADAYAQIEPMKDLKIKSVFGINYGNSDYRRYTPKYQFSIYDYSTTYTKVDQNMSNGFTLTWTNTASYDFTVADDHEFNALIGTESSRYQGTYLGASNGYLNSLYENWGHAYLDNTLGKGTEEGMSVSGKPNEDTRTVSYFARLGYNYKEKYMLNATMRADGSSKFASGNRWGYFPSVSAGWVMTNESFLEDSKNWLDFLKLRLSWGQVGNQNIDNYMYVAPIQTSTTNYIFGSDNLGGSGNVNGAYPSRLANKDIKWETSEQTNIGIDAIVFENLSVNADFYIKKTKDWLVEAPVLATAGADAPYINGGDVKNTGIELALNWHDNIGDFHYNIGVNGAYNKNEVGKIPTDDGIIHGQTNMLYDNCDEFYRASNGHAIGYFWGYKTAGLFQTQEEIDNWNADGQHGILQSAVRPGDVKYVDINKDGKIDDNDKTDLGNGMPDYTYGFNIGFNYKNFDFSLNANGVIGNKIVQSWRNHANKQANYSTSILNRWTGPNTSNKTPRVTETNINWQFSDLYIQDGDFLRISNITLGYDFAKLINCRYISQARLYVQAQNVFTFTKYDGMDPEIGYSTEDNGWATGIDLGYYPRPRTYLVGVNIKF